MAEETWNSVEIIQHVRLVKSDDTTSSARSEATETQETGAFEGLAQEPSSETTRSDEPSQSLVAGWQSLVEVEVDEKETISAAYEPGHQDRLKASATETRMRGFYTMRYNFGSDSEFRPYAGAGVGVIAAEDREALAGALAARAIAGFDIAVNENSGFFAEYAFLKSSDALLAEGDAIGSTLSLPDDEHSIKVGFRRAF